MVSQRNRHSDLAIPPYSVEAEQGILGGILLDNSVFSALGDLGESDFYRDDHRRIYRHICALLEDGLLADVVTVADHIERSAEAEQTGGLAYLGDIANGVISTAAVPAYVRLVRETSIKRSLMSAWGQASIAASNGIDAEALISLTENKIAELRDRAAVGSTTVKAPLPMDWPSLAQRNPPPRGWLIEDWLGAGHPTLFVGPGGIGKSMLAQQAGSCLSIKRDFLGHVVRNLRVLMWMCEDDHDELFRRQVAISHWLGVPLSEFTGLVIQPRIGLDNTLLTTVYGRPTWTPLMRELRDQCADYQADVWFGDNIGQMFGANENVRHDVTMFVNGICGACGRATPIMLGHPSRGAGSEFSGSSAWENAVRMRWWFSDRLPDDKDNDPEAERDDSIRYLSKRKTNYSIKDFRQFSWSNGVFAPSISNGTEDDGLMLDTQSRRCVINGITRLAAIDVYGSESPSATYLPALLLKYGFSEGLSGPALAKAMRALMVEGKIIKAVVGRDKARRTRIALIVA